MWFDAAARVVEATNNPDARRIYAFLQQRTLLAEPREHGELVALEDSLDTQWVALVPLVEEGWSDSAVAEAIARHYLAPLRQKGIDTLVLGCTHYPLMRDMIQRAIGKKTRLIDPAEAVAAKVAAFLSEHPKMWEEIKNGVQHVYVSDVTPHFSVIASKWLGRPLVLERTK
jgi:glutamate racemase